MVDTAEIEKMVFGGVIKKSKNSDKMRRSAPQFQEYKLDKVE